MVYQHFHSEKKKLIVNNNIVKHGSVVCVPQSRTARFIRIMKVVGQIN